MSVSTKSLKPLAPVLRQSARSLATASRPARPNFDDEPGLPELQIPSPNVYPKTGSNVLEVRSNLPYHTLAHTLAIVRAVEVKCGRVIDIVQPRVSRDQLRLRLPNKVLMDGACPFLEFRHPKALQFLPTYSTEPSPVRKRSYPRDPSTRPDFLPSMGTLRPISPDHPIGPFLLFYQHQTSLSSET
jgi:hypothetical protein